MSWMVLSITATLLGTVALALVYLYLYAQNRERCMGVWTISWALFSARYVFELWMAAMRPSPTLLIMSQVLSLLGGLFLLWGTNLFMGKRLPRSWVYGSGITIAWIVTGALHDVPFHILTLPTFLILAAIFTWTGISFLSCRDLKGVGATTVGWAFVVWGVHKADYPFLRPLLWFAPWGYMASALLQFVVAVGIILVYFEKTKKDLTESERRFRLFTENALDLIYRYNIEPELGFEYVSPSAVTITGYELQEFYSNPDLLQELQRVDGQTILDITNAGFVHHLEPLVMRWRRKDGGEIWIEQLVTPLHDVTGKIIAIESIARDITERKKAEDVLNHLAYYDSLTDLPNRALITDRLSVAIAHARRHHLTLAILCLDLDNFKTINDTLGHEFGDELLKEVADRLTSCLREGDTVARLGGDEFGLLLPQIKSAQSAERVVEKIEEACEPAFKLHGRELRVTTSLGIAIFPNDGDDAQTLLKNANAALYRAKEQGRNTCEFYDEAIRDRASERFAIENSLRTALENEEFVVHYQPQVDLDSGEIVGMEALIRWQHPDFGLVYPGDFISFAEEMGLIVPIGAWVLKEACMQNKRWQESGYAHVRVAVNLSARQFQQPNLVKTIETILDETGLDPRYLELEITESAIMKDVEVAVAKLALLQELGTNIAIDDFGTGYSSLSYLKRFPIDVLKIDRSFITDITSHAGDAAITRAIITLAHDLKLKAIAEGVETVEQIRFLRSLSCDLVQGYLFSKPVPAEDAVRMLAHRDRLSA